MLNYFAISEQKCLFENIFPAADINLYYEDMLC